MLFRVADDVVAGGDDDAGWGRPRQKKREPSRDDRVPFVIFSDLYSVFMPGASDEGLCLFSDESVCPFTFI